MCIDNMKDIGWKSLEPLKAISRKYRETGVGLIAVCIGTLVTRIPRISRLFARKPPLPWARVVRRLLRGPGRLNVTAFARAAGRMILPGLFT